MTKPIHPPTTGRPLDLSVLLDVHPEQESPLMDVLCLDISVSEYAACDALRLLASSWADDAAENRRFVLSSLEETIRTLKRMRDILHYVVGAQDCLDAARDALLAQPVAQASSRVRDLLTAHDTLVSEGRFKPETHAALVRLLFPHVRTSPEHAAPAEHAEVAP